MYISLWRKPVKVLILPTHNSLDECTDCANMQQVVKLGLNDRLKASLRGGLKAERHGGTVCLHVLPVSV